MKTGMFLLVLRYLTVTFFIAPGKCIGQNRMPVDADATVLPRSIVTPKPATVGQHKRLALGLALACLGIGKHRAS